MSNKRLIEREIGEFFEYKGIKYELLGHDDSGSLSSGPTVKRLVDNKIMFLCYDDSRN